jgi:hypothetical protein
MADRQKDDPPAGLADFSRELVEGRLAAIDDDIAFLPLGRDVGVVVSARTGRVYGPFVDGLDPIGWIAGSFAARDAFDNFVLSGDWNYGAERLWFSPELEYFVADRDRFWQTYAVPPIIDPGRYTLSTGGTGAELSASFELISSRSGVRQTVNVCRQISPVPEVAVGDPSLTVVGYRNEIFVESDAAGPPVVPWIVRQVRLGGRFSIAAKFGAQARTFVGHPPGGNMTAGDAGFAIDLAAGEMFKVAFAAKDILPSITYLRSDAGVAVAVVLDFDGQANGTYFEEPPDCRGDSGYSAFLFRDDGRFGGYAELEVVGQLAPNNAGGDRKLASLTLTTTLLMGPENLVADSVRRRA